MECTDPPPSFWPFGELPEIGPIPEILHSTYLKGPFRTCTVCDESLDDGRLYEVERVFRGREPVFEMAICLACAARISREFSRESTEAIRGFLEEHLEPRQGDACGTCGCETAAGRGRTVSGILRRGSLVVPMLVICETCEEALQGLLSEKTRGVQGDFIDTHFPGVPAGLDRSPTLILG
ncbi:MAG: hypothetical protein JXP34_21160 [Planctomycetes bacterium]|nr:hypothetical protein [Planctomycetota bacterium]